MQPKAISLECSVAMPARWGGEATYSIGGYDGASLFKLDVGLKNHIYLSGL